MQFFVSSKGQRLGPFSIFQLSGMITEGEVSPNDLGWHQGREQWTPLSEIPALKSVFEAKRESDLLRESGQPIDPASDTKSASKSDPIKNIDPAPGAPTATSPTAPAATQQPASTESTEVSQARPASRFWARIFDYLLVVIAVYAIFGAPPVPAELKDGTSTIENFAKREFWQRMSEAMETPEALRLARIQQAALVIWVLLEGFLLHRFGTTPGKALFSLRVTAREGGRPGLQQAMIRAFFVWLIGVGMWLPLLSILTLAYSIWSLKTRGNTFWDRQLGTRVQQGKLTIARIVLAFAAFLAILLVQQAIITAN